MTDIKQLLNKYETPYGENRRVKNEHTSKNYRNNQRKNAMVKDRHLTLDLLLNETHQPLNIPQKQAVKKWIDLFQNDWKNLHRQSKDETILLALIIIQYTNTHYKLPQTLKEACLKYNLDWKKYTIIQNRVIFLLMKNTPLKYTISENLRQYQREISQ